MCEKLQRNSPKDYDHYRRPEKRKIHARPAGALQIEHVNFS
jgi:hypothetical protein